MWLRDFLGKDVPHFRTMIYGYNARIDGHAGGTLEEYAQQFLEDLKDVRSTADVGEPFVRKVKLALTFPHLYRLNAVHSSLLRIVLAAFSS